MVNLSFIPALALALPMFLGLMTNPVSANTPLISTGNLANLAEMTMAGCEHHEMDTDAACSQELSCSDESCNQAHELAGFDWNRDLVSRDNTKMGPFGLFSFFAGALKALAVWAGVRLTKWVWNKINNRANQYTQLYYQDPGVQQAGQHWDDLLRRSQCTGGYEPDHMPNAPGFQGSQSCPICKAQVDDLAGR